MFPALITAVAAEQRRDQIARATAARRARQARRARRARRAADLVLAGAEIRLAPVLPVTARPVTLATGPATTAGSQPSALWHAACIQLPKSA